MEPQTPADGIHKHRYAWDESESFVVHCDCTSDDHSVEAWIEVEDDYDFATVTFYIQPVTPYTPSLWKRVKMAFKLVFTGFYQEQHSIYLGQQAAVNFHHALKSTIERIEAKVKHNRELK